MCINDPDSLAATHFYLDAPAFFHVILFSAWLVLGK